MSTAPPPRAGRREWIGLGVIALPCLRPSSARVTISVVLSLQLAAFVFARLRQVAARGESGGAAAGEEPA